MLFSARFCYANVCDIGSKFWAKNAIQNKPFILSQLGKRIGRSITTPCHLLPRLSNTKGYRLVRKKSVMLLRMGDNFGSWIEYKSARRPKESRLHWGEEIVDVRSWANFLVDVEELLEGERVPVHGVVLKREGMVIRQCDQMERIFFQYLQFDWKNWKWKSKLLKKNCWKNWLLLFRTVGRVPPAIRRRAFPSFRTRRSWRWRGSTPCRRRSSRARDA